MLEDQHAEQPREHRTSLLSPQAFWKVQAVSWGTLASLILVFYWPSLRTFRTFSILSLKLILSVLASLLLRSLCRFVWRRRGSFVPLAIASVLCAMLLALINEAFVEMLTRITLGVPETVAFHSVLSRSLRYQFALGAWCLSYFGAKFLNQIEQQRALISKARMRQKSALIASLRSQLLRGHLNHLLNGLSRRISNPDITAAAQTMARLRDCLYATLEHPDKHLAPLADEIAHAREFVSLQRVLLDSSVSFEVDIDADAGSCTFPRWLLASLIEDASSAYRSRDSEAEPIRLKIRRYGPRIHVDLIERPSSPAKSSVRHHERFKTARSLVDLVYGTRALVQFDADAVTSLRIDLPTDNSAPS